ncbi:hypothetical protein HPB50_002331 [Hyalomma asiaticum]|uniref:Uncharacterized protein n=1 Tax=Hyalomma asiaticum TaxID=266040 RepID=A0ACB7RXX2_HYAAI|nr:hypothetical protein HPB50_002331 [Hyalomma asiaticum]
MDDTWSRVQLERTIPTLRASTGSVSSRGAIMAATKCVRKLQRPRPLLPMQPPVCDPKRSGTPMSFPAEDVGGVNPPRVSKQMLDLCASLGSGNYDARTLSQIAGVCNLLKVAGAAMEPHFEADLDRCFDTFRNAARRNEVPVLDRVRLLEIIELRASGWKGDKDMDEYYARKYEELGAVPSGQDASAVQQACALQQAARNEQLSHTGTAELEAKATAPPVSGTTVDLGEQPKTPCTVADGERKEFTRSVLVGTEVLRIVGANEDTVRMAASVLHSFFTNLGTDTSSHVNQTPSCVPSEPSEALMGESVARPLSAMSQSSSTADAPSAQSAFDRYGITSGSQHHLECWGG